MTSSPLRADCSRCAGLCCVALAFDRSLWFAADKPAGLPCPHLSRTDRCTIHATRGERGFSGCISYDCAGAGQRVTQELFGGRSWRTHPEHANSMFAAFRALREVHELRALLDSARDLPLDRERERRRHELELELEPTAGWSLVTLATFERGPLPEAVRAFLRSLRELLPHPSSARRRHLTLLKQ